MRGSGIETVGVNVGVGVVLASGGVVCDVVELMAKVFGVADAVFVIVVLPERALVFVSDCE